MSDQLQYGPPGFDLHHRRRARDGYRLQVGTEPIEGKAVVVRDAGDETGRCFGAILSGAPSLYPGGPLGDKPLEGAVGVGPRQTRRPRYRVAGPGSTGQEDLIDQTLGRGESEMREIDPGHW